MGGEDAVRSKEDEESIRLYLYKLSTFAHKEPKEYFSIAENDLGLDEIIYRQETLIR